MSETQGPPALGRSLAPQHDLLDAKLDQQKTASKALLYAVNFEDAAGITEQVKSRARKVLAEHKEDQAKPNTQAPFTIDPKAIAVDPRVGIPPVGIDANGKGTELGKTIEFLAKEEKPADISKRLEGQAQINTAGELLVALDKESKERIDLYRLELSVTSGKEEREQKEKELRNFIESRSPKTVSDGVYAELVKTPSYSDLYSAMSTVQKDQMTNIVAEARELIVGRAAKAISGEAKLKQFNEALQKFDERAAARNLPESERLGVYMQLNRILDPAAKLPQGNAGLLAKTLVSNAADPTTIDQGAHNTCNVTTLECRLYTQEPSTVARVVADVAVTGQFKTADGSVIRPESLAPDLEAKFDPTPDGLRNYASLVFQNTAINVHWMRKDTLPGGVMAGKGNIEYRQGKPGEPEEYLLNKSVNPPVIHHFRSLDSSHPWLDVDGLSDINAQITGKPSKDFGIQRWFYPSENNGVSKFLTFGGLKEKLQEYKDKNSFPVIIAVNGDHKPFGSGNGFAPHVVTVTDYDAATGLVTLDNQWGKDNDITGLPGQKQKITARELYDAMSMFPSFDFMKEHVEKNLKDIKKSDILPPTIAALSSKGLRWGLSGAAPLAVRGGLGTLSEWGVPGAAKVLAASETKIGSALLRTGTGLGAFAVFAAANDLPGAFKEGNSRGVGRLTRVLLDTAGFDLGAQLTSKAVGAVGLKWAPARLGLMLAAGTATATILDRVLGEGAEIAGSELYERGRDMLTDNSQVHLIKPKAEVRDAFDVRKNDIDNLIRIQMQKPVPIGSLDPLKDKQAGKPSLIPQTMKH